MKYRNADNRHTSNTEVGLENLAERGNSIQHVERQEALILRAMERSRRAMNPNNYNENSTVKKGHKQWIFSNDTKIETTSKNCAGLQQKIRH